MPSEAPPESPAAESTLEDTTEAAPPAETDAPFASRLSGGALTEMDALEHDLLVSEKNLDAQLVRKQKVAFGEEESADGRFAVPPPSESNKASSRERPRAGQDADKGSGSPAARPASPTPAAQAEAGPEATGHYLVGSPCDIACRALGSMQRSAERLCVLAGASHSRCQQANARVTAATHRVRQAGCLCVDHEP